MCRSKKNTLPDFSEQDTVRFLDMVNYSQSFHAIPNIHTIKSEGFRFHFFFPSFLTTNHLFVPSSFNLVSGFASALENQLYELH